MVSPRGQSSLLRISCGHACLIIWVLGMRSCLWWSLPIITASMQALAWHHMRPSMVGDAGRPCAGTKMGNQWWWDQSYWGRLLRRSSSYKKEWKHPRIDINLMLIRGEDLWSLHLGTMSSWELPRLLVWEGQFARESCLLSSLAPIRSWGELDQWLMRSPFLLSWPTSLSVSRLSTKEVCT